jgi:hypothetical protein
MFYEGKLLTEAKQKREWVNQWNTMGNRDLRRSDFVQDFHSLPQEKYRWNSTSKKSNSSWCTLFVELIRDSLPSKCLTFYNLFLISTSQQLPSCHISLSYRQFLFLISILCYSPTLLSYIIDLQMAKFLSQSCQIIIYNIKTSMSESD